MCGIVSINDKQARIIFLLVKKNIVLLTRFYKLMKAKHI